MQRASADVLERVFSRAPAHPLPVGEAAQQCDLWPLHLTDAWMQADCPLSNSTRRPRPVSSTVATTLRHERPQRVTQLRRGDGTGRRFHDGQYVAVQDRHVLGGPVEAQMYVVHDELNRIQAQADQATQQLVRYIRSIIWRHVTILPDSRSIHGQSWGTRCRAPTLTPRGTRPGRHNPGCSLGTAPRGTGSQRSYATSPTGPIGHCAGPRL
jgi:hypothetical protein